MPTLPELQPVIRVERCGALPIVSVRPAPDDVPAIQSFDTFAAAEAYAAGLSAERGWRFVSPTPPRRNRKS